MRTSRDGSKDPEVRWLTQTLLFHDPTTHYRFQSRNRRKPGPESLHYPVPPAKSLFGKHNERGLPIGNLTSQFWGNVYLNELDRVPRPATRYCRAGSGAAADVPPARPLCVHSGVPGAVVGVLQAAGHRAVPDGRGGSRAVRPSWFWLQGARAHG
ncbi:MAG: hypothetical protein ACREVJ_13310, partial [Gammaproteobacteria bacterium]